MSGLLLLELMRVVKDLLLSVSVMMGVWCLLLNGMSEFGRSGVGLVVVMMRCDCG